MTSTSTSDLYRLKTRFEDDGDTVVHLTSNPDGAPPDETRWSHQRDIGRGASGTVSLQQNNTDGTAVRAVKRMLEPKSHARELNALCDVADRHDLFVTFLGWYHDRYFLYIAMEYIEHGDLSNYMKCRQGPISKDTTREITRQVLKALTILHERKICHRDLKPQNILIASLEPLRVKVADFGSSKILKDTKFRTRVGTEGYFAPELLGLWTPEPTSSPPGDSFTYAVDIWSLGCLLYELLTGTWPFASNSPLGTPGLSTAVSGVLPTAETPLHTDIKLLYRFCSWEIPLPVKKLGECNVSSCAIFLIRRLLSANPSSRPSAPDSLGSCWFRDGTRGSQAPSPSPGSGAVFGFLKEPTCPLHQPPFQSHENMIYPKLPEFEYTHPHSRKTNKAKPIGRTRSESFALDSP